MKKTIFLTGFYSFLLQAFFVCIVGVYLESCCDKETPTPEKCLDFKDLPKESDGYKYVQNWDYTNGYYCSQVDFNPNNANEFVALLADGNSLSIVIYDLTKRNFEKIYTGVVWDKPRWSSKNWIIFGSQGQLFKLKSNGDSLTQITNANLNHYPCWSPDGSKITYMGRFRAGQEEKTYLVTATENGEIIDSLLTPFEGDWGENNIICSHTFGNNNDLLFYTYPNLLKSKQISANENILNNSVNWIPNTNKIIWSGTKGIYLTNYDTEQTSNIKVSCETQQYVSTTISANGQKILSSVMYYVKNKKQKQIDIFNRVILMNIDGSNEEEIIFSN